MDIGALVAKWHDISSFKAVNGFEAVRISPDCLPELYIATDNDGGRCLLLFLPPNAKVSLRGTVKEKLELSYIESKEVIIIKLLDLHFVDLFNDLIFSLYTKIKDIPDADTYTSQLIQSFFKWSEFFSDRLDSSLSGEEVKGLFGELFLLKSFLTKADANNVDSFLESWKGPYDVTNDFVFDDRNIEVKTKETSKLHIRVSSEHQLEEELDKGLELFVVSVKVDVVIGESIHDLLLRIVQLVRNAFGDLSILYYALGHKGLTVDSTREYDNLRFVVVKTSRYDCCLEGFPRLSVSNIPDEISSLRYDLRIASLEKFLLEEKTF